MQLQFVTSTFFRKAGFFCLHPEVIECQRVCAYAYAVSEQNADNGIIVTAPTYDPICGLVQVPCIERNAVAAMRALNSANLAFFLSETRRISYDTVLKSMYNTGLDMKESYRETSEGGLAKAYSRRGTRR